MQQRNAGAALYDHHPGVVPGDAGDAVMARWLQSAGLQHLASPLASTPNALMKNAEEKQKIYKLLRSLNFNGEFGSEACTSITQGLGAPGAMDGFSSPELRGEFGAGLLDLHAMDDTGFLSEHVMSETFEPAQFIPPNGLDNNFGAITLKQQRGQMDSSIAASASEKETTSKENNVAKIKVVVRKRPLNKKEISRKEDDIVTVNDHAYLTVHEPKLKVDLTAYVEKHEFCFDAVLDEHVTNDEVYRVTVQPIIPTIFQQTKATCFAYGQTGSGKTFTMQPLPLRASEDIFRLLHQPYYHNQKFRLWLSYFEIYGGKLFDLLSDRRKLCMREDGRQQVCIVGLQEFEVSDVQIVKEFIEKGNAARSTGSTGANEESSRSHAILQLAIKKHNEVIDSKKNNNGNKSKGGKLVGKISFIDLAGSERGADTTDNDRQTRIEGAEINKSLLALKECIRALDNDQIHIPFRGSKLTEVLRDSFVGNSRTVMISCISPNSGSCEHTLNTLRYADRVKSLSKSGNSRRDQATSSSVPSGKESSSALAIPLPVKSEDNYEQNQEVLATEMSRRNVENCSSEIERNSSSLMLNYPFNGREEIEAASGLSERDQVDIKNSYISTTHKLHSSIQNSFSTLDEVKLPKAHHPHRKQYREEKYEKQNNWPRKDSGPELPITNHKQQQMYDSGSNAAPMQYEQETSSQGEEINAILKEEEALILAHRKEIENTMEVVREEMKLLAAVGQPGSPIDNYVSQLSFVLSRKAAGLVSLQARLARFQHRLKEQEILSRKKPLQ